MLTGGGRVIEQLVVNTAFEDSIMPQMVACFRNVLRLTRMVIFSDNGWYRCPFFAFWDSLVTFWRLSPLLYHNTKLYGCDGSSDQSLG